MDSFFLQDAPPGLSNTFTHDAHLQRVLEFFLKQQPTKEWNDRLTQLGEDAAGKLLQWSRQAETEKPILKGQEIEVSQAWNHLCDYAAKNGLVASGYDKRDGAKARLLQMALLYLYHPSSAFFSCPLAMTDGAVRALQLYGDQSEHQEALKHLLSTNPKEFWTSGQWMTEKTGGSDVGLSQTVARKQADGTYRLTGTKWFTSATTSQMTMTLARPEGAELGGRGLSLFFIRLRDDKGKLRGIEIDRLKSKLGTQGLPTAELRLEETPASLVGGAGSGIKKISTLFNITRIYNAICSISTMQRGLAFAHDFSHKRFAFGKILSEQPLHRFTFQETMVEKAACTALVFRTAELWGRDETGEAAPDESALLRLMTTLGKLYTGKKSVQISSEVLEMFGGAGYIEDYALPGLLRDAQVFPIWEGTTNVLSLDVFRALAKECPFSIFAKDIRDRLQPLGASSAQRRILEELRNIEIWLSSHPQDVANARGLAFAMSEVMMKSLLCQIAAHTAHPFDQYAATRFCERHAWQPAAIDSSMPMI